MDSAERTRIDNTLEQHHWRLYNLEIQVPHGDWLDPNLTEPAVQLALKDLLAGGDVAFDVRSNNGTLAMAMSRAVGPKGHVCAFEANPQIARQCQRFLVYSGCGNVQLYNNAVYHTSNEILPLYVSPNKVADSLYYKVSETTIPVVSLALDDFVNDAKLTPRVVKMDIEGAEFDALMGFSRAIMRARPILILEQQTDDDRCLQWLKERYYTAIDLYEYRAVNSLRELTRGAPGTDILYIPTERLSTTCYQPPFDCVTVGKVERDQLRWENEQTFLRSDAFSLSAGRYRFAAEFAATDAQKELKVGVSDGSKRLFQYHGSTSWLSRVGRTWIIDLPRTLDVFVFFEFPTGNDPSFEFSHIAIERIAQFDNLRRRAWL